jgi:NADPH:quinone reductase-like Zn-dependent oxidoreductase
VRELTDGRGVDCIVEIGGPGTIAMSLKALAVGGHVSLIGASLSSSGAGLDPLLLTGRGITLSSISVGSRADFEASLDALQRCHLPFEDAPCGHVTDDAVGFVMRGSLDDEHECAVTNRQAARQYLSFRLQPNHAFEMGDDRLFEQCDRLLG